MVKRPAKAVKMADEQRPEEVHASTFGYRRLWALLRFGQGIRINRKAVYRVRN
jgi:hypothetical protein